MLGKNSINCEFFHHSLEMLENISWYLKPNTKSLISCKKHLKSCPIAKQITRNYKKLIQSYTHYANMLIF